MSINSKFVRERERALRCTTAVTQDSPELVRSRDSLQESSNTILFRSYVHHVRLVSVFAERLALIEYVALVGYFFHEDTRQDVFIHECHVGPTTAPERMNTSISLGFSCVTLEEIRKVNFRTSDYVDARDRSRGSGSDPHPSQDTAA